MEDKTIEARDKAFTLSMTETWKVRQVKPYADAANHIFLGKVLNNNLTHVVMDCVTFHFGKKVDNVGNKDIVTGMRRIRRIPWYQIEVVHDLTKDFDFTNGKLVIDGEGTAVFRTEKHDCIITKRTDRIK